MASQPSNSVIAGRRKTGVERIKARFKIVACGRQSMSDALPSMSKSKRSERILVLEGMRLRTHSPLMLLEAISIDVTMRFVGTNLTSRYYLLFTFF